MSQASALVMLVLAVLTAGCRPADEVKSPRGDPLAPCQVTDIALAANTSDDRPWALSDAEPRQGDWRTEEAVLQVPPAGENPRPYVGWNTGFAANGTPIRTDGPSVEMARAFALSTPVNGNACPEVRARADAADRRFSSTTSRAASADPQVALSTADVMLDRAVVSPNGREAIVYLGQQFGPRSGGGYLILYRKLADGWTEAARLPLWLA